MRKHFTILLVLFLAIPVFAAKKPKTIDEAVSCLEKKFKKKEKAFYKNLSENDALIEMDSKVGVWIRNEWIRFTKDTTLRSTFHQMGITHADDMSDIIITSYYRKLKNLPLNIESEVKRCKEYWTPVRECEEKAAIISINNYDRFKTGDSITIFLYAENLAGLNGRVIPCPYSEDWGFDYKKDIIVKGLVSEKYFLYGDPHMKVQISSVNREQAFLLYKPAKVGDIVEFPLKSLLVKQPLQKDLTKKLDKVY
ncbi:MAG: hypothetical protein KA163_10350 [Bacteroidia bacterium]|nr:hypothetical protein [Bacteroidia bacterium]